MAAAAHAAPPGGVPILSAIERHIKHETEQTAEAHKREWAELAMPMSLQPTAETGPSGASSASLRGAKWTAAHGSDLARAIARLEHALLSVPVIPVPAEPSQFAALQQRREYATADGLAEVRTVLRDLKVLLNLMRVDIRHHAVIECFDARMTEKWRKAARREIIADAKLHLPRGGVPTFEWPSPEEEDPWLSAMATAEKQASVLQKRLTSGLTGSDSPTKYPKTQAELARIAKDKAARDAKGGKGGKGDKGKGKANKNRGGRGKRGGGGGGGGGGGDDADDDDDGDG
jgi:hypothetical protein